MKFKCINQTAEKGIFFKVSEVAESITLNKAYDGQLVAIPGLVVVGAGLGGGGGAELAIVVYNDAGNWEKYPTEFFEPA